MYYDRDRLGSRRSIFTCQSISARMQSPLLLNLGKSPKKRRMALLSVPTTGDQRVGKKARRAGLLLLPISPFTVAASSRSFLMLSNPSLVELSTARENHPKLVSGYSDTAFEQN